MDYSHSTDFNEIIVTTPDGRTLKEIVNSNKGIKEQAQSIIYRDKKMIERITKIKKILQ